MYDKIELVLDERYLPEDYNWNDVLNRIVPYSYLADNTGGRGWWHGRFVKATETSVSIEGSIPKFLLGHNLKTLSLKEVKGLIMQLSKDLGVPMHLATVKSVEFAHNFVMKESPELYIEKLSTTKKLCLNGWNGTKYMVNEKIRMIFYDKMKEAKKKKELPKYGKGDLQSNLLRYEITFHKKGLDDLFGKEIIAEELWSKKVFWKLVAEWFGYFEEIDKLPSNCWDVSFNNFKNAKDFDKWCVCIANTDQNLSYYMKKLFRLREDPKSKDRIQHGYIQKRIQEALKWKETNLTIPDLTLELTEKIEQYLTHLLEQSQDGMTVEEEQRVFNAAC